MSLRCLGGAASGEVSPMAKCWTTSGGSALRQSRSKAGLVDLQLADLRLESGARNAESLRRPRCTEHPTTTRPQRVFDDRLLLGSDCAGEREPPLDRRPGRHPALIDPE